MNVRPLPTENLDDAAGVEFILLGVDPFPANEKAPDVILPTSFS